MGYTHWDVAHNWAHQLKKSQGDRYISFYGNKIKSYNTVIGEIVHTKDGTPVYFLNTGHYSTSTAKHQNCAFGAIPNDAVKFSISCDDFQYGWRGTSWDGDVSEGTAKGFVVKCLSCVCNSLLEFKTSRSWNTEKRFSLHYFDEAVRFMQYFPLTSFSKVLRTKNEILKEHHKVANPVVFRKVVRAILSGNRDLKSLVDVANGDGTYDAYYLRTVHIRNRYDTMRLNDKCGFETIGGEYEWYVPYPYKWRRKGKLSPKSPTYISYSLRYRNGKRFTSKEILEHRKKGDLISILCKAKKINFEKACKKKEEDLREERVESAKRRLEIFIGLSGWLDGNYHHKRPFKSFNYNGVEYVFHKWNTESYLTTEEYSAYVAMSLTERAEFIFRKRSEMLDELRRQDDVYQCAVERREKERIERERELEEKRKHIEYLKEQGDDGIRQLFHEGLVDNDYVCSHKSPALFYGGNVLLRVKCNGQMVVTSKGIIIQLDECKRLWATIKHWHDNNAVFCSSEEYVNDSYHSSWNIQRYQNDIMIAGCHAIAYREMETIAKQLNFC